MATPPPPGGLPQVDAVTVGDCLAGMRAGWFNGPRWGLLEAGFFPTDCYLIAGTKTATC
ncbi:MAG: hypothetical protein H7836_12215 [Magnetococcus sp. YQC-3]